VIYGINGGEVLIDQEDLARISLFTWRVTPQGYARHDKRIGGKLYAIHMHNFLIGRALKPNDIDHINRNKLDNRKINLRVASKSLTKFNQNMYKNNKSGVKGVFFNHNRNQWQASYAGLHLGWFRTKNEAIQLREEVLYGNNL